MMFPSKFDVDLTRIVKKTEQVVYYCTPSGEEFKSFDNAALELTQSAIYQHISPPRGTLLEELLMVKDYRDRIREVIDYLDRD